MGIILIGTGSRTIRDRADQNLIVDLAFRTFLRECRDYGLDDKISLFKHGNAPGFDILADAWCKDMGIETLPFPAKWHVWSELPKSKILLKRNGYYTQYSTLASFLRNQKMVDSGFDAGLAVRMPGVSQGTDDMIERMRKAGRRVMIYHVDGDHEWL